MAAIGEVSANVNFPSAEEDVLKLWKALDAFKVSAQRRCAPAARGTACQWWSAGIPLTRPSCRCHTSQTQLKLSEEKPEYTFYDGPPFATGLPHYGHLLAGTIKDTVTRYATQTGHYVSRRFGWDTHGLPVEYEIDKKLGIKGRDDVLAMGIDKYNAECRSIVMRYSSEWQEVVTRMGRWIDFEDDYKTLEPWYMESVWWVFKSIFDKGLVYQGFKVMPYSTACSTPLSNFEAGQNYHDDTTDPAVVVSFPLVDDPAVSFVAWTTTPWTLPSNLALCVHPELEYVQIKRTSDGAQFILARSRLSQLFPKMKKKGYKGGEFEEVKSMPGAELGGKQYTPLFPFFEQEFGARAFRVLVDTYVTDDAGTGVVHQAPGFGEDDFRVCSAAGVIVKGGSVPCPVDADGRYTDAVPTYKGVHVKEADATIMADLSAAGRLVQKGTIKHRYPFCWRSDTPLIYRVIPSWFVNVTSIKDRIIENNKQAHWVPGFVGQGRFHKWLEGARDWAVSRNRFWGTPIPIWTNEDGSEVVCIGSIQELAEKSGVTVTDLHRESIDHITIPSADGKGVLRRIDEVFDCWFESGSMPYAQLHYPFEHADRFDRGFPADFIAEGLDQTRGWFYTLMVLSTALFDKPAFKNCIVNGLVLASDGKKMSKRLKNYPDPSLIINKYGADAVRLFLINSPAVHAEPLPFKEEGVLQVVKSLFNPWVNAARFWVTCAQLYEEETGSTWAPSPAEAEGSPNDMDHWIMAAAQGLIKFVRTEMEGYRLYTVMPRLVTFIDQLTNWYVRLNRLRLKGTAVSSTQADRSAALAVLYEVLMVTVRLMSPFTPFLSEHLYQQLRQVHPAAIAAKAATADVGAGSAASDGVWAAYGASAGPEAESVGAAASVHFLQVPEFNPALLDPEMEARVAIMQEVVIAGRQARDRRALSVKYPIRNVTVVCADPAALEGAAAMEAYIKEELNTLTVSTSKDMGAWCTLTAEPEFKVLAKRVPKSLKAISAALAKLTTAEVEAGMVAGKLSVAGETLTQDEFKIALKLNADAAQFEGLTTSDGSMLVVIDVSQDDELRAAGLAREVSARIQKLRKAAGLQLSDAADIAIGVFPRDTPSTQVALAALKEAAHKTGSVAPGTALPDPTMYPATVDTGAGASTDGAATDAKKGGDKKQKAKGGDKKQKAKGGDKKKKGGDTKKSKGGDDAVSTPAAASADLPPAEAAAFLGAAVAQHWSTISDTTRSNLLADVAFSVPSHAKVLCSADDIVGGALLRVSYLAPAVRVCDDETLKAAVAGQVPAARAASAAILPGSAGHFVKADASDEEVVAQLLGAVKTTLAQFTVEYLHTVMDGSGALNLEVNGAELSLKHGVHFFTEAAEHTAANKAVAQGAWAAMSMQGAAVLQ